jgi:hypothetical protein
MTIQPYNELDILNKGTLKPRQRCSETLQNMRTICAEHNLCVPLKLEKITLIKFSIN